MEEKHEAQVKRLSSPNTNSPDSILKAHLTRLKNGTSKISKAELAFKHFLMINGFAEDDILCQYVNDPRYPYNCDFYIKSKDLFIEYQGHQTHGIAPFDSTNCGHIKYLVKMQNKGINMSTWTNRDPLKLQTAISNKINLVLVYPRNNSYVIKNGIIKTIDINDINKI